MGPAQPCRKPEVITLWHDRSHPEPPPASASMCQGWAVVLAKAATLWLRENELASGIISRWIWKILRKEFLVSHTLLIRSKGVREVRLKHEVQKTVSPSAMKARNQETTHFPEGSQGQHNHRDIPTTPFRTQVDQSTRWALSSLLYSLAEESIWANI